MVDDLSHFCVGYYDWSPRNILRVDEEASVVNNAEDSTSRSPRHERAYQYRIIDLESASVDRMWGSKRICIEKLNEAGNWAIRRLIDELRANHEYTYDESEEEEEEEEEEEGEKEREDQ